jgi:hypothetical protein
VSPSAARRASRRHEDRAEQAEDPADVGGGYEVQRAAHGPRPHDRAVLVAGPHDVLRVQAATAGAQGKRCGGRVLRPHAAERGGERLHRGRRRAPQALGAQAQLADRGGARRGRSRRVVVRPASVRVVVVAGGVLGVALGVAAGGEPDEHEDRRCAAGDADDAPDRVRERRERQPGYFRSTTIVFTEAVTPSATSTTTT